MSCTTLGKTWEEKCQNWGGQRRKLHMESQVLSTLSLSLLWMWCIKTYNISFCKTIGQLGGDWAGLQTERWLWMAGAVVSMTLWAVHGSWWARIAVRHNYTPAWNMAHLVITNGKIPLGGGRSFRARLQSQAPFMQTAPITIIEQ